MEESTFETFEEELGTPLQDAPPPKPIRQARRPEMYAQRRMREDPPVSHQVPKTIPREPPSSRTNAMSGLRKALSMQSLSQVEVPFQGVTLNRCLFIAITILVITSGFQRLHETLRGRRNVVEEEEEESGLSLRHSSLRKHHREPEPKNSVWDTFLWWVADDDDDDEKEGGRGRKKRGAQEKPSRSLRHRSLPGKSLLKESAGSLRDRRRKRRRGEEEEEERVRGKQEHTKRAKKIEEEDEGELEDKEEKPQKIQNKAKKLKEKQTQPKEKDDVKKKAI
ncbi:hypothetical protein ACEWY4_006320 [Coilia grayii]|uniref:Uncharacterized protein n=1 Tax=Coilia grayii TaxID=363190 RepID=A0ABD1KE33_9TELE